MKKKKSSKKSRPMRYFWDKLTEEEKRMSQKEAKALLTQVETKKPDIPIFKTVDSIQRIRIVYAFHVCGMLYEFDTLEQAILKRQAILESQEPNTIQ